MPITFGSVGDIISVSLLINEIINAVDDARGSSAEYQAIFRELLLLDRALLQIEQLARSHEAAPELTALYLTACTAVDECWNLLGDFVDKIKKYQSTLGQHRTSNFVYQIGAKALWVTERDDIARFRAAIGAHTLSLNVLIGTASLYVLKFAHDSIEMDVLTWARTLVTITEQNLRHQSDAMLKANANAFTSQGTVLSDIRNRFDQNNRMLASINSTSQSVLSEVTWSKDLGVDLKSMVQQLYFLNISTYRAVLSLQSHIPNATERSMTFLNEPVIFEDALGRIAPVHIQLISTWDIFDAVLLQRFAGLPELDKVRNCEFVLECRSTRRDIGRARPLDASFLPGQKVDMSILLYDNRNKITIDECPKCRSPSTPVFPESCPSHEWISRVCDNESYRTVFKHVDPCDAPHLRNSKPETMENESLNDGDNNILNFKHIHLIGKMEQRRMIVQGEVVEELDVWRSPLCRSRKDGREHRIYKLPRSH